MNLVGHVAVALAPDQPAPPVEFLVGCMLPDLAAIARVRVERPDGTVGQGVAFHHACDAAFHESEWFRAANRELRDALLHAGVDSGPARACSHAGVEMLLDGGLVAQEHVAEHAQATLAAVDRDADELGELAPLESREVWVERLHLIGRELDPARYADARFVAERLHRMTAGRRRIELRAEHVDLVTSALVERQPSITAVAPRVVQAVRQAVPSHHLPG
ncbi:MAG: hypothetical protein QOF40_3147 [Actinomycetota bacterium]|jgi:hypothetical protein|nr:hypothetical protein [Actinomycetota bacterium]